MDGGGQYNPRTVEEVFKDFKGRRTALIKALTTNVEEFFQKCDPEKENLCLYGFPNEHWEVNLPAEEVPPEMPEPALGINFARDGMQEKDWLSLVAIHGDAWLLSVAFYFGGRFGFDKTDRKRLFNMMNDLPTIFEVITRTAKKQSKEKSSVSNHSSTKSKSNPKARGSEPRRHPKPQPKDEDEGVEEEEKEEDEHGDTLCGACGENYASNEKNKGRLYYSCANNSHDCRRIGCCEPREKLLIDVACSKFSADCVQIVEELKVVKELVNNQVHFAADVQRSIAWFKNLVVLLIICNVVVFFQLK